MHSHVGGAFEPTGLSVRHQGRVDISVDFSLRMARNSFDANATGSLPQVLVLSAPLGFSLGSSITQIFRMTRAACGAFVLRATVALTRLYVFRTARALASIARRAFQLTLHSLWQARHSSLRTTILESGSCLGSVTSAKRSTNGRTRRVYKARAFNRFCISPGNEFFGIKTNGMAF